MIREQAPSLLESERSSGSGPVECLGRMFRDDEARRVFEDVGDHEAFGPEPSTSQRASWLSGRRQVVDWADRGQDMSHGQSTVARVTMEH